VLVSPYKSLRVRLITSVVIIEIVMLSLLVWSNLSEIRQAYSERLRDSATRLLEQVASTAGGYLLEVDYASLEEYLRSFTDRDEFVYLSVLDRDGQPVVTFGELPPVFWPPVDVHPLSVGDGRLDLARDILIGNRGMGRVHAGFSLGPMQHAINSARLRSIGIAATEILLTILATVFIGLHLTRRLDSLALAAQRVGSGDYAVSVPAEIDDEVGMTAKAFNRMVAEVSQRTRTLEETLARERIIEAERQQAARECRNLLDGNRFLIQKSLVVQEEERRHLARELHDELGQCMTAIQADAENIHELSKHFNPGIASSAAAILAVAGRMYDVVHSMMQRLRPSVLDNFGLVAAIEEELETWKARHPGITCQFDRRGDLLGLGEQINITLYRIVQECLTNVARHAQAGRVSVVLGRDRDAIHLHIEDDGRGMDVNRPVRGLGMLGMRERVEALGGSLSVTASPGKGTAINVVVPVASARQVNDATH
jgi:signal transduction histidine kinase